MLQQNAHLFRVGLGLDSSSQGWSIDGTWGKEMELKLEVHDYLGDHSNLPSCYSKMSYCADRKQQFRDKMFHVQVNKLCFCKNK